MLRVLEIYPTIQGEGCLAGVPMVLVRLQGCSVGCRWCDTKESWPKGGKEMDEQEIVNQAVNLGPKIQWVMLTGGEPLEQDVGELLRRFRMAFRKVCMETSGTAPLRGELPEWVCVSPKDDMPGGLLVRGDVLDMADEIKVVVCTESDIDRANAYATSFPWATLSLQPVSGSKKALELCVAEAMRSGRRLSIQTHKLIGVR